MIVKRSLGGIFALALLCGGAAAAESQQGEQFIKKAIQGNYAEVQLGKLGQEKGGSNDVRTFGDMLVEDHSAANEKAIAAAKTAGVTPPAGPSAKQKEMYKDLSKLSGKAFDRQYMQEMVKDHKKDIDEYKEAAGDGSGPIADYAKNTLPTLQKHLRTAQKISK